MERRLSVSVDLQRNRKTLNHSQQHVIITHKEIMMQTSMSVRKCSSEHRMGGTDKTPFITAVLRVFTGFSDYTLAISPSPPRNCLKRSNFFSLQRSQSHWHQLTHTCSACQSSVVGCEHAALWLRFLCGLYNSCVYVCVHLCVSIWAGFSYKSLRLPPSHLCRQHKRFDSSDEAVQIWLTALNVKLRVREKLIVF